MNLKQSIGLVFHKLLDWKTIINPLTDRLYPELYNFKLLSKRKKTTMLVFITPTIEGIDRQIIPFMAYSRIPLDVEFKVGEGNTDQKETAS